MSPRLAPAACFGALLLIARPSLADDVPPPSDAEASPSSVTEPTTTKPSPSVRIPVADAAPMRYPPSSVRLPLILGGLGFTVAAYGATAATGYGWQDAPGATSLYIPIAGPWIALAENRCPEDGSACDPLIYARGVLEVLSGLAQLGGIAVAAEGIFATTEAKGPPRASMTMVPVVSRTMTGVSVGGSF